jgi:pimeloyl-ACP methyl ester carboxylesterase
MTTTLETRNGTLAYDDTGGDGTLMLLLPGAGDVRSEHRFLSSILASAGHRVVTMDLRGHGDSLGDWPSYGVAETAGDILDLIDHLDAGPATVVGNSFAPAAALWAAAERPESVAGIVAISPHLEAGGSLVQRLATGLLLRGPFAKPIWSKLYRGWYKTSPPADLDAEVAKIGTMLDDPDGRRAARETLLAARDGLAKRMSPDGVPALTVFGSLDDHFDDPEQVARETASKIGGQYVMIEGAGHYPHVEQPEVVAEAIGAFVASGH